MDRIKKRVHQMDISESESLRWFGHVQRESGAARQKEKDTTTERIHGSSEGGHEEV